MSWKKNAFSYLIWFVYTVLTGVGLMGIANRFCTEMGLAFYWGAAFVFLYGLLVWGIVLLLHGFARRRLAAAQRKREHLLVLEALALVVLLAAGIMLRAAGVEGAEQSSVYYDMAKVAAGQKIPQTVHGAVYFYAQMLHGVFGLLGNHFLAGIWVQIVLQLGAMAALYFTVRRLAGAVAALVTFGFGMCGSYMVQSALVLSPDMLYFLLLAVSGAVVAALGGEKKAAGEDVPENRAFGEESFGEGKRRRRAERAAGGLRLPAFFLMGILAAVCCYMDVMGLVLLFLVLAMAFCRRREAVGAGRKAAAAAIGVLGAAVGFGACVLTDAFLSGKTVTGVAQAWLRLYEPGGFRLPVVMEAGSVGDMWAAAGTLPVLSDGAEGILLLALMAFGVFSFWCDRRKERISVCVLSASGIALASCYGIFTEEMPGFFVLYLLFALLAGLGLGQCFHVPYGVEADKGREAEPGCADETEEEDRSAMRLEVGGGSFEAGLRRRKKDGGGSTAGPKRRAKDGGGSTAGPRRQKKDGRGSTAGPRRRKKDGGGSTAGPKRRAKGEGLDVVDARIQPEYAVDDSLSPQETAQEAGQREVRYLENPMPLPKKHVKRVLDYALTSAPEDDDFDHSVADDDDFDI